MHKQLQDFVDKGYITPDSLGHSQFWPHGIEIVLQPKSYEAVVFHDFFVAGLQFPLEKFVSDMLERF
jgi:hypothetical protein